jgi:uncharacterized protein (TIGR03085 family)
MLGGVTSLARRERHDLCDLALTLGPDAPTLCGDWTVKDLVVHLLVRERSLIGAPGIALAPLSGLTDREMSRVGREDFEVLVRRLRTPSLLLRVPKADAAANTVEFFVHHEDIRRAQPGWQPRPMAEADQDLIWSMFRVAGRGLVKPAGVPVQVSSGGRTMTLRGGEDPVVVSGPVSEIVFFLFGRDEVADVALDGPSDACRRLQETRPGA